MKSDSDIPTIQVFGITVEDLPEKWQGLEVAMVVKALDDDGKVSLLVRYSEGLKSWEAIGMLRTAEATELHGMVAEFVGEDDDDE